ncbi:VIT1/CCC1 transporter family protein [Candidatus Amarolinea aalborgensis]|jgi:VIT1/CCC1 family predicted Fe2+/Mn2+ transporter|uniref:VIT1/CCC1 transporter family protein n=1 Tax=Candidatus Amarolinea aalborgensis TaxID=2249329 RepID=UPI003BF9A7F2
MATAGSTLIPARESHGFGARLSEIILGGQDGLVNTLGVILGIAAASQDIRIIIAGGLAATFAESISMGAVAYTSSLADADFYHAQMARERREIKEMPDLERLEIREIFQGWSFEGELLDKVVDHVSQHEEHWVDIMMAHELELQPVDNNGLLKTALLVGFSAVIGSIIPLFPFFFLPPAQGMVVALVLSALALFIVGYFKARITVGVPARSGLQMMIIGIASALAGYLIGALFGAPAN